MAEGLGFRVLAARKVLQALARLATPQASRLAKARPKAPAWASVLAALPGGAGISFGTENRPSGEAKAFGRAVAAELRARVAERAAEIFEAQLGRALDPPKSSRACGGGGFIEPDHAARNQGDTCGRSRWAGGDNPD